MIRRSWRLHGLANSCSTKTWPLKQTSQSKFGGSSLRKPCLDQPPYFHWRSRACSCDRRRRDIPRPASPTPHLMTWVSMLRRAGFSSRLLCLNGHRSAGPRGLRRDAARCGIHVRWRALCAECPAAHAVSRHPLGARITGHCGKSFRPVPSPAERRWTCPNGPAGFP